MREREDDLCLNDGGKVEEETEEEKEEKGEGEEVSEGGVCGKGKRRKGEVGREDEEEGGMDNQTGVSGRSVGKE